MLLFDLFVFFNVFTLDYPLFDVTGFTKPLIGTNICNE